MLPGHKRGVLRGGKEWTRTPSSLPYSSPPTRLPHPQVKETGAKSQMPFARMPKGQVQRRPLQKEHCQGLEVRGKALGSTDEETKALRGHHAQIFM